jgi:signal transduction histidine kinase
MRKFVDLPARLRNAPDSNAIAAECERLLMEGDLEYAMREAPIAIDQSLEGTNRVARIVRAMRDFAHPDNEKKTHTDLNRCIETVITVARNEWKYVAKIETQFDSELPLVLCQPGEIEQAILNLLVNAAHAIGENVGTSGRLGRIQITTSVVDDHARIRITDNGTGIPEQLRDKVFEPFFTTKEVGKGTGQGLAIVRSVIVQKHQGKIWFESESGIGTSFIIELPIEGIERQSAYELQGVAS